MIDHNKKYLIVSDLDGTLLNKKGKIDVKTAGVINKITKMGHIFIIITGRPLRGSLKIYNDLKLKNMMVNFNGSHISNPSDKKFAPIKWCYSFDLAEMVLKNKKIMALTENYLLENDNSVFIHHIPQDPVVKKALFASFHIHDKDYVKVVAKNFINIKGRGVHAILLRVSDEKKLTEITYQLRWLSQTLITRVWFNDSYGYVVEINSVFSSKGRALQFLSSYYGVPLNHCMSFGDGDNDIDMLQYARYGFAMKNATVPAKLASKYITKFDNDNLGVAQELSRFFVGKNKL